MTVSTIIHIYVHVSELGKHKLILYIDVGDVFIYE